jgi:hypothetical protein
MKKVSLSLAAIALVGFCASTASAQCAFNAVKAKGVKGSFVRNFAPCPGTEHPAPNAETEGDTDACTPVTPKEVDGEATAYTFGPKGSCTVQTQAKLVSACEEVEGSDGSPLGLEPGPCHITYVKGKCKDIVDGSAVAIDGDDAGWGFATLSRASLDDETNGDMTVIDFPVTFAFGTPSNGGMKINSNSAEQLSPLVGANNAELPTCTSIEIVDVTIKDPLGLPFAKLGGATIPDAP